MGAEPDDDKPLITSPWGGAAPRGITHVAQSMNACRRHAANLAEGRFKGFSFKSLASVILVRPFFRPCCSVLSCSRSSPCTYQVIFCLFVFDLIVNSNRSSNISSNISSS